MRWLLRVMATLAALALVLTVGLLAAGGWKGTARNAAAIELAAPAAQVFPYLTDPELLPKWLGGLVKSEPLTAGGPRVGAKSKETVGVDGARYELEVEITDYRPPQTLGVRITHPEFSATGSYELRERGGRTVLIYEGISSFTHPFSRLLSPVVERLSQQKLEEDLLRLASLVTAAPAPAAAPPPAVAVSDPAPAPAAPPAPAPQVVPAAAEAPSPEQEPDLPVSDTPPPSAD